MVRYEKSCIRMSVYIKDFCGSDLGCNFTSKPPWPVLNVTPSIALNIGGKT